jgi:hypothetical protein
MSETWMIRDRALWRAYRARFTSKTRAVRALRRAREQGATDARLVRVVPRAEVLERALRELVCATTDGYASISRVETAYARARALLEEVP